MTCCVELHVNCFSFCSKPNLHLDKSISRGILIPYLSLIWHTDLHIIQNVLTAELVNHSVVACDELLVMMSLAL